MPTGDGKKPGVFRRIGAAVSRRGFLKGGMISATTAALGDAALGALQDEQQAQAPPVVGPDAAPITLRINGQEKRVEVEPRTTLAEALRIHLDLTGTKVVCDRGSCSACTVFADGMPILSCMTLAIDAQNREITTIEGLATGDGLHPVQEQFIQHDATQCGFCTPGMIMSCAALLERNKNPSVEDVKAAVSGNLCRCGTYVDIFNAVLEAAKVGDGTADKRG
jgi:xanthine dehydrogenase YagT iron-sulfur-binding subunit